MMVCDLFSEIATHMVKGLMIHDQLSQIFCYLGLPGYEKIHKQQYLDESKNYNDIVAYYISRYHRLLPLGKVDDPGLTKNEAIQADNKEIRITTKKKLIDECFSQWVAWEKDTKCLYQRTYSELIKLDEISSAARLLGYINEVDEELTKAHNILFKLRSLEFDMTVIYEDQPFIYSLFES